MSDQQLQQLQQMMTKLAADLGVNSKALVDLVASQATMTAAQADLTSKQTLLTAATAQVSTDIAALKTFIDALS